MRQFIAIDIPTEIKNQIFTTVEPLYALDSPIKWVEQENYHVTLSFIGDTDSNHIESIKGRVEDLVKEVRPFRFSVRGIVFYPSEEEVRVIALPIEQGKVEIDVLGNRLSQETGGDFKSSHVTIGRVKGKLSKEDIEVISCQLSDISIETEVETVTLFKSDTLPAGPVYTPLEVFQLKGIH